MMFALLSDIGCYIVWFCLTLTASLLAWICGRLDVKLMRARLELAELRAELDLARACIYGATQSLRALNGSISGGSKSGTEGQGE